MIETFGPDPRIGLVGLGATGLAVAQRLAGSGHAVVAWNLEPERYALVKGAGVAWAASPAAVRAASDLVLLCVRGDDAVEACCFGPQGFASAGGARLLVDLSTTSPQATLAMASRMARAGMAWIDAPVWGAAQSAREGTPRLLLGGDQALCAAVAPVLRAIAAEVTHAGPLGAGQEARQLDEPSSA